jgi:uncharacterized protein GlcG (DUF336 family)
MMSQIPTKQVLNLSVAKDIAQAAELEAQSHGWNVVIALVDDGGHLVYLQRMDGTQLASIAVAVEKATSAVHFKRPTKAFEESLAGGRQAILSLPGALPVEGGLPLVYRGEIIGAIGVSGVQSDQDGVIAQAGTSLLESLL